jgi:hypothetical protein
MSSIAHDHAPELGHDEHAHHPTGITRWLTTTNHKDIGTMYLWFSFTMFLIGGTMAMVIRAELFQPGLQIVNPEFFNSMTTLHGLIMVFGAIMPAAVGFANWQIPLMIGAPDMAFARMNNWSFWLPAARRDTARDLAVRSRWRPPPQGGRSTRRSPCRPAWGWTSRSSPSTFSARRRSWARSTSSRRSSICAHPG